MVRVTFSAVVGYGGARMLRAYGPGSPRLQEQHDAGLAAGVYIKQAVDASLAMLWRQTEAPASVLPLLTEVECYDMGEEHSPFAGVTYASALRHAMLISFGAVLPRGFVTQLQALGVGDRQLGSGMIMLPLPKTECASIFASAGAGGKDDRRLSCADLRGGISVAAHALLPHAGGSVALRLSLGGVADAYLAHEMHGFPMRLKPTLLNGLLGVENAGLSKPGGQFAWDGNRAYIFFFFRV
jgi:hypothetical protein